MTRDFFIGETPCFGTHSSRDAGCRECVLSKFCSALKAERKAEKKAEKKEDLKAQAKLEEVAKQSGVDLSHISVPSGADLSKGRAFAAKRNVKCTATGKEIASGDQMVFVPSWGILSHEVARQLGFSG